MKVDALPDSVGVLPDPGFFPRFGRCPTVFKSLDKAHVADDGGLGTEHPHLRRRQRGVVGSQVAAVFEIELVEGETAYLLAPRLGLETGEVFCAESGVSFPVG